MTIKIEFPADNKDAAREFGKALLAIAGESVTVPQPAPTVTMDEALASPNVENPQPLNAGSDTLNTSNLPTTTETQSTTQTTTGTAGSTVLAAKASGATHDEKGVAYDPKYCSDAAKPFYTSGPRKGQWKKKGGAGGPSDDEYDTWYADQKFGSQVVDTDKPDDEPAMGLAQANANAGAATANEWPNGTKGTGGFGTYIQKVATLQQVNKLSPTDISSFLAGLGIDVPGDVQNPDFDWANVWNTIAASFGVQ